LSGGDGKALSKELGKARAMTKRPGLGELMGRRLLALSKHDSGSYTASSYLAVTLKWNNSSSS
jgi:hypothetical protein